MSRSLLATLAAAFLFAAAGASAVDIVAVSGTSMEPRLVNGERLFVSRLHYGLPIPFFTGYIFRWSSPKKGDIVVYAQPTDGELAMKRVWAAPGTPFHLRSGTLTAATISASVSPFVAGALRRDGTLPHDRILVIGDNRISSRDSRHYGPVDVDAVVGKVILWR